jgi:hypothetical protein
MRNKSAEADVILNNPLFQEAFTDIREGFIKKLRDVSTQDVETVLEITRQLQTVDKVKAMLEAKLTMQRFTEHNDSARRLRDS